MNTIVFQQFMAPEMCCLFEDPLVQETLPHAVSDAVRAAFSYEEMGMVTFTWGEGDSATFYCLEKMHRKPELKSARECFDPAYELTAGARANYLRKAAYHIDEDLQDEE